MTFLPYRLLAALALLAGLAAVPGSAVAGRSYDNCTGFIDSLPATISTQGTWCLRADLGTAITSGVALRIAANNVTIDCNDFKIGGLAAGDDSVARGIYAGVSRHNATVRHCNVRGFHVGISFHGGAGHLIEDNRLDNNLIVGIYILGDNNLVQRNRIFDTGGSPGTSQTWGMFVWADVIDNTVAGVFAAGADPDLFGIVAFGGSSTSNNRVRGLRVSGAGRAFGIDGRHNGAVIDGNQVTVATGTRGIGIIGPMPSEEGACSNNVIAGFNTPMVDCTNAGGNTSL